MAYQDQDKDALHGVKRASRQRDGFYLGLHQGNDKRRGKDVKKLSRIKNIPGR
jgi:hypothetical protein